MTISLRAAVFLSAAVATAASAAGPKATDTVVWTGTHCTQSDQQASSSFVTALLGLIFPSLAQAGIKGVGEALKRAGQPADVHVTGWAASDFFIVKPGPVSAERPISPTVEFARPCVLVAFGPVTPDRPANGKQVSATIKADDTVLNDQRTSLTDGLEDSLASAIDRKRMTVLVAQLQASADGTAFRLVPQFVRLGGAMRSSNASALRTVAITLSLMPPSASPDGTAAAVRTFPFSDLTAAKTIAGTSAEQLASDWIPMPALSDAVKARAAAATKRQEDIAALEAAQAAAGATAAQGGHLAGDIDRLKRLAEKEREMVAAPMTWRADLHETGGGSKLLVGLGEFVSGKSAEIAAPIFAAIDPSKAEHRASAEDQLRLDAITAADAYEKARSGTDAAAKRIAEIKARAGCRRLEAAGFADPACALMP